MYPDEPGYGAGAATRIDNATQTPIGKAAERLMAAHNEIAKDIEMLREKLRPALNAARQRKSPLDPEKTNKSADACSPLAEGLNARAYDAERAGQELLAIIEQIEL